MTNTPVRMPENIELVIEDDRWAEARLMPLAARAFGAALTDQGLSGKGYEIVLMACNDARIAKLNAEFRGKPTPTNVLSWPEFDLAPMTPDDPPAKPPAPGGGVFETSLGDIAISYDTCTREAEAGGIPFDDHVTHLLVHSCLHLLGFDHETEAEATRMEALETKILETMGIKDPY